MLPLVSIHLKSEGRKFMNKKSNNRVYPKVYIRALARQAREELETCKSKKEMVHLNVLIPLRAEDKLQDEILFVLKEMNKKGNFERLVWKELVDKIIIE